MNLEEPDTPHNPLNTRTRIVCLRKDGTEFAYYRESVWAVETLMQELKADENVVEIAILEAPKWISGTVAKVLIDLNPATSLKH